MKIALAQFDSIIGDFQHNIHKMAALAQKAVDQGCELVVFPEMCICGYPPKDLLERKDFVDDTLAATRQAIDLIQNIGVVAGTIEVNPSKQGKPLFNTAILFENGRIIHSAHKRLLPSYDVFDETRYFEPGQSSEPVEYKGRKIGLTICEDIWFAPLHYETNPVEELADKGAGLFITISASPFDIYKADQRKRLLEGLSSTYESPFLYCNTVGGQDCILFDGRSEAFAPGIGLFAQAHDFKEDIITLDPDGFKGEIHTVTQKSEEAVIEALKLGLTDYMKKCGFSRVVLGLSGGIDSSVTCAIATQALGPANVLGVLMPSPYTSSHSIEDALGLAKNLGIETVRLPITDIFSAYIDTLSPLFEGRKMDVTEENIQARIRGNLLMALSNKLGHLVLSTGNKTELAVGYCTLYGDLSGGYALISDVPKTMVYRLADFINKDEEIIPSRVLTKPPSAELRPDQKDQDDLPPYEIIDGILEHYLEHNTTIQELAAMGYDIEIIKRITSMVDRSEYKRRQAPIGPKVTSRAFGCGRRYPISHKYRPWNRL